MLNLLGKSNGEHEIPSYPARMVISVQTRKTTNVSEDVEKTELCALLVRR